MKRTRAMVYVRVRRLTASKRRAAGPGVDIAGDARKQLERGASMRYLEVELQ